MASGIQSKLTVLLSAYKEKGYNLQGSMAPGLSKTEIQSKTSWFPSTLCPEIIELYMWHNGQHSDPAEVEFPFWFRDNAFISIENSKDVYEEIVKVYAEDNDPDRDGVDLLKCFPFASFNGECYLIPCCPQRIDGDHVRPVINQNGEIYYYSIETMVSTVIDWVKHPDYKMFEHLPQEVELYIWRLHNPGIFE